MFIKYAYLNVQWLLYTVCAYFCTSTYIWSKLLRRQTHRQTAKIPEGKVAEYFISLENAATSTMVPSSFHECDLGCLPQDQIGIQ